MAGEVDMSTVEAALSKREAYIMSNMQTMGMKSMRRLVEADLGLPEKALDGQKKAVNALVDKMVDTWLKHKNLPTTESKPNGSAVELYAKSPRKTHSEPGKTASSNPSKGSGKAPKEGSVAGKARRRSDAKDASEHRLKKKARLAGGTAANGSGNGAAQDSASTDGECGHVFAKRDKPQGPIQSTRIKKMKQMLKDATIRFGPSLYSKNRDEASLAAALLALLSNHGLSLNSNPREVQKVRNKLQLARDLEGIDTSNIIENGSRRRSAVPIRNRSSAVYAKLPGPQGECSSPGEESGGKHKHLGTKQKAMINDKDGDSEVDHTSNGEDNVCNNDSDEFVPSPAVAGRHRAPQGTSGDELSDSESEESGARGGHKEDQRVAANSAPSEPQMAGLFCWFAAVLNCATVGRTVGIH
ncbi:unnamed protein product [Ostreobium quekettii]|uniref:Histone chaperone domain-containing protein n=1 Tax=Ostreobium quekettii TaxID=121088 RepID=A0A8S1IY09_9CHLO|nr:unnamed protein product [Ostreobium quekettii]